MGCRALLTCKIKYLVYREPNETICYLGIGIWEDITGFNGQAFMDYLWRRSELALASG